MIYTLLVDANVSFRQALSDVLHVYFPSIGVEEAGDVAEALSKVESLRPDIIFMDNQLPEENGLDLSREIKHVYDDIVIVILTTNNQPEYRQQALRNGADYYISKGDDSCMEEILTQIEGVLDSSVTHRSK
jgi:DNA-binding NarL/FixJ family response regulator